MNKTNFVCGICGDTIAGLDEYVAHVKECGSESARLKAEQEQKRLEELNAAINKVRMARSYYEECLLEFKKKYPKEYELNFGADKTTDKTINTQSKASDNEVSYDDFMNFFRVILGVD